jgi:CelD/BcsL family acetyltransferase involved in cellulose biosynthesis
MNPDPRWTLAETRGRAGLLGLEADWRRLFAAQPLRTSFLAFEACLAYVDHMMEAPDELRCLALSDGREVRAITLLEPRLDRRLGRPVRVWGVLWHRHGHQADVLCPDEEARRVLGPLLVAHVRGRREGRSLLVLGPVPEASVFWEGIRSLGRFEACSDPKEAVRVLDCTRPFEAMLAACSKKFRRSYRTDRKNLMAMEGPRFTRTQPGADLGEDLAAFFEVEASGWKAAAGTALRQRKRQPDFFRALAATLKGGTDHFEILALHAQGRCIASTLCTRTGATYSCLKIGMDPAFGKVSPGQQLLAEVIERCCSDPGIRQLELVSPAVWVRGWATEAVPLDLVYVSLGGWRGWGLLALLRLRLGPVRRIAQRARAWRER